MGRKKERLDLLVVARGLAPTRSQAQALVLAGRVSSRGVRLDKPGTSYAVDVPLDLAEGRRYVSRAGHKLAAALAHFAVQGDGRRALDVGASTGGFTQVLLEAGFASVVALDVGRGQLDWGLRQDPRVHVIEGCNARSLVPAALPWEPAFATVDVSFISLRLVLPAIVACLAGGGELLALIKPQFEAGRREVGRGGIVRSPDTHREVLLRMLGFARANGWGVEGICDSTLPGADGNREFFVQLRPASPGRDTADLEAEIAAVVAGGSKGLS